MGDNSIACNMMAEGPAGQRLRHHTIVSTHEQKWFGWSRRARVRALRGSGSLRPRDAYREAPPAAPLVVVAVDRTGRTAATCEVRALRNGAPLANDDWPAAGPQFGVMRHMRAAWLAAESLGVDVLYSSDHFNALVLDQDQATRTTVGEEYGKVTRGKNFEGTTIQAAMAATTSRPRIGAIVHANSYRNPNLMADIARTIDHISGGRFILGMGTGYLKLDYEDYGYTFGTQKERSMAFARDIPIIKARLARLSPPPVGRLPLLVASMGPIGMRVAAEHADMWHVYGTAEKVRSMLESFRDTCALVCRDPTTIEVVTYYFPQMLGGKDADPSAYLDLGIRHLVVVTQGPSWDLGQLRELLQWRSVLSSAQAAAPSC